MTHLDPVPLCKVDGERTSPLGSTSSRPRKPAKRSVAAVEDSSVKFDKHPSSKRRRRAFSCLSCQKLKCRCEYESGSQGCRRCQTLRIECSLRGEYVFPAKSPSSEQVEPSVEERLRRHEQALQEIKGMVQELTSLQQHLPTPDDKTSSYRSPAEGEPVYTGPQYMSDPADRGIKSAPVVVLREIGQQVTSGCRRLLSHVNLDLIQLQLLDEQTADDLILLYRRHTGHTLLACTADELARKSEPRKVSAFLHSVCCLYGIVYRDDLCGGTTHRQVYEHVRMTLGQALLSSPLNLEEINAVLIMSNNANTPNSHGTEYLDSWLLTGYCAKQAMLSIGFSKIVDNIRRGDPTLEDHRAIRLWSTICLHHFHWAGTTGRPSIIPNSYVNQCDILLSFYEATMQDGMLVAEILLYSMLHQKLARQSYLGDVAECEEFLAWKQKWNHLLVLPTSSMLKIGYYAACLILAVRSLEETGNALGPKTLMSNFATDQEFNDDSQQRGGRRTERNTIGDSKNGNGDCDLLRANVCKYAMLVLQTFLDTPAALMDTVPTCFCLCIGYCALVLAHHDESHSKVSDQVSLDLVTGIDEWIRTSPGKAWSFKYGALAKHKVETRINRKNNTAGNPGCDDHSTQFTRMENGGGLNTSMPTSSVRGEIPRKASEHATTATYNDEEFFKPTAQSPPCIETTLPSFDMNEQVMFPSMEVFFGGGFLDFVG